MTAAPHGTPAASVTERVKPCRGCGTAQPLSGFHRHSTARDGRQARCKACVARANRERYHATKPPAKGHRTGPRDEYCTVLSVPAAPPRLQDAFWADVRAGILEAMRKFDTDSVYRQRVLAGKP